MKRALGLVLCAGCAVTPARTSPALDRRLAAAASGAHEPTTVLALGEYGEYCVRLRGSAFCGDLRFDEPLAKGPPVGGFTDVVDVALGPGERCVIRAGGTLHCSGDNQYGQLGAGLRDDRVKDWPAVLGLSGVTAVSIGSQAACAIDASGLSCWGRNEEGQTGSGVSHARGANELVRPVRVPLPEAVRAVHLGYSTTCALLASGAVACFGSPVEEKAGPLGTPPAGGEHRPHVVTGVGPFLQLTSNERGFCGIDAHGAASCFGDVDFMALDDRGTLRGLPPLKRVAASASHACSVAVDGGVWCVGRGTYGVLGRDLGDEFEAADAARVEGVPPAVDVLVSGFVSCAVTRTGAIWCWGGELQGGTPTPRPPTRMRLE